MISPLVGYMDNSRKERRTPRYDTVYTYTIEFCDQFFLLAPPFHFCMLVSLGPLVRFGGLITSVSMLCSCRSPLEECRGVYAQIVGLGLEGYLLSIVLFTIPSRDHLLILLSHYPLKPPASDTQFVGKLSSFLRRLDQVWVTSFFGMAFWLYLGCVIL